MATTTLPVQLVDAVFFGHRARTALAPRDDPLFPLSLGPESIPQLRQALLTLDSRIRSLADQKTLVESQLASAVALQCPVRRLPREVLARVFILGVRDLDDDDPLFLSRATLACRHWRDVALDTPELWARIVVDHHNGLGCATRRLQRSKGVPLDISIDFSPRTPVRHDVSLEVGRAIDLLRSETHRWRTFRLRVPHRAPALAALARCTARAPLLEHFSVHVHMSFADTACVEDHTLAPLFQGVTPRLRYVDLVSAPVQCGESLLLRGLHTLRLVDLRDAYAPSVSQLLCVLRACPQLEELSLRNMDDVDAGLLKSDDKAVLPCLRNLTVSFCGVARVCALLECVIFPAVEHVEFAHLDNISPALGVLSRQAQRGALCALRTLRLDNCLFSELKLVRLLRRLPGLTTLELVDCDDVSANLLRGLSAPPPAQAWILPALAELVLDGCAGIEWEALRELVEQRGLALLSADIPPLRMLDVSRCPQMSRGRVQLLRMYVREVRCEGELVRPLWTEA